MREFYLTALSPLGYAPVIDRENVVGLGISGKPCLWIKGSGTTAPIHFALRTTDKSFVDSFYTTAMKSGGTDNGAPGIRNRPYATNYAAFIFDPEQNNLEVVCDLD